MGFSDKMIKAIERDVRAIYKDAVKKEIPKAKKAVEDSFKYAVDTFYEDYAPMHYARNKSMYDLLNLTATDDNVSWDFDPDRMTQYERGVLGENGLYDLTFRKGYHGGAAFGDTTTFTDVYTGDTMTISTPHPNPGTPYYRRYPDFLDWGNPAAHGPSPLELFKKGIKSFESESNERVRQEVASRVQNEIDIIKYLNTI